MKSISQERRLYEQRKKPCGYFTRRNKYHVSPPERRTMDGICFSSLKEMEHYQVLKGWVKTDPENRFFLRQTAFHLPGKTKYLCDFLVFARPAPEKPWTVEVWDVKGVKTQMYRLKKRQVEALYPIKIREV
jgi:hypothetical protein